MSDENKIRDAADAVKGIVEAVPVYQDVVQPAAKELGNALQTVARSIHIALAPVSMLVWGYDQIRDYLNKSLSEKLKDVPTERIIAPNPTIAGPTVEALRFAAHDTSLRELYSNLLATAMDAETAQKAHPAFVDVIRHLAPDEARIVQLLASGHIYPLMTLSATFAGSPKMAIYKQHVSLIAEDAGCEHPDLILSYLDNLRRLGLVDIHSGSLFQLDSTLKIMQDLENHEKIREFIEMYKDSNLEVIRESIVLSSLGRQFCDACVT